MKRLEAVLYEIRPFTYLVIALVATAFLTEANRIGQASVAVLAASSLLIFYWRYQHRTAVQYKRR